MDDLANLRSRLAELIEAKVERARLLRAEADAIDAELADARTVLATWAEPSEDVSTGASKRNRTPRSGMTRDSLVALLKANGPMSKVAVLTHFDLPDGRSITPMYRWIRDGYVVRRLDGRLEAAADAEPSTPEPPLPRVAHPRFA